MLAVLMRGAGTSAPEPAAVGTWAQDAKMRAKVAVPRVDMSFMMIWTVMVRSMGGLYADV